MSLPVLLKTARTSKKLSLRRLGYRAKVHYVTIQRIEAGLSTPTLDTLQKLADALGLDRALVFQAAA